MLTKILQLMFSTAFIVVLSVPALARGDNEDATPDPEEIIESLFWGQLYKGGGNTYYCGEPFQSKTPLIVASYVYSATWIRDVLQCGTSRQCKRESEQYNRLLSDLHNLVPADSYFDFKRKNALFGTLDESVAPNKCGIRKKLHVIEPPTRLKGDIARILFYMHHKYKLPLMTTYLELKRWHDMDPPDADEKARDAAISALQGAGNPFVRDPGLANSIAH